MYQHITVFMNSGNTLRFMQVTDYEEVVLAGSGTGALHICRFKYVSASDGKSNSITINFNNVAAVAKAH